MTQYLHKGESQSCKGVHSLMPDLGHVTDGDGLGGSSLWLPPEVWANGVRQEGLVEME